MKNSSLHSSHTRHSQSDEVARRIRRPTSHPDSPTLKFTTVAIDCADDSVQLAMEPAPDPHCIKYLKDVGFESGYKHHIFNAIICLAITFYIARNAALRQSYKYNLIPILVIHAIQDCAFAVVNSIPDGNCYPIKSGQLLIFTILGAAGFTIKPYFILHSLIRQPCVTRYEMQGLIASVAVPISLFILPAVELICGVHVFDDQKLIGFITIATSVANLGISIYLIKTGQTSGSHFPLLMALYEGFYAIPEMLKYSLMIQLRRHDLYWQVEGMDNFMFILMASVSGCVLYWTNTKRKFNESNRGKNEEISFDNNYV